MGEGLSAIVGVGQILEAQLSGPLKGLESLADFGWRFLETCIAIKLTLRPIDMLHPLYNIVKNCQIIMKKNWTVSTSHV